MKGNFPVNSGIVLKILSGNYQMETSFLVVAVVADGLLFSSLIILPDCSGGSQEVGRTIHSEIMILIFLMLVLTITDLI